MLSGLLIGLVILGALGCPVMMLLGRRGIGPGCAICPPRGNEESLEVLQARQRALTAEIEQLEARPTAEPVVQVRD